jgi:hypothetical protein
LRAIIAQITSAAPKNAGIIAVMLVRPVIA